MKYTAAEIKLESLLSANASEEDILDGDAMFDIAPSRPECHTSMSVADAFSRLTGKPYDVDFFRQ